MESILRAVLAVSGVSAAMVYESSGRLLGHEGHAVHDRSTCAGLGATLFKAVDAVGLQQEDWDTINARFTDGRLLLSNLGARGGRSHVLAVVADASLNPSFATIAMRVATNKLRKGLSDGSLRGAGADPPARAGAATSSLPPAEEARPALGAPAESWSKGASSAVADEIPPDAVDRAVVQELLAIYSEYLGPAARIVLKGQLATLGVTSRTLRRPQLDDLLARLTARIPVPQRQQEFTAAVAAFRRRVMV